MRALVFLFFICVTLSANVGEVVELSGDAYLIRDNYKVDIQTGDAIEQQDTIKTGDNANVSILFSDKTRLTVGSNSQFRIEKYLFNKKEPDIKLKAVKGFFKILTGGISKVAKHRFKLKTRNATIGIRGTEFIGVLDEKSDILACTKGAISVSNSDGSQIVESGYITKVIGDFAPMPARAITDKDRALFESFLQSDQTADEANAPANYNTSGKLELYAYKKNLLLLDKEKQKGQILPDDIYKNGVRGLSYILVNEEGDAIQKSLKDGTLKETLLKIKQEHIAVGNKRFALQKRIDYTTYGGQFYGFLGGLLFQDGVLVGIADGENIKLDFSKGFKYAASKVSNRSKGVIFDLAFDQKSRHNYVAKDLFGAQMRSDQKGGGLISSDSFITAVPYTNDSASIEKDLQNSTNWGFIQAKWNYKGKLLVLDARSLWVGGEEVINAKIKGTKKAQLNTLVTSVTKRRKVTTRNETSNVVIDYDKRTLSLKLHDKTINFSKVGVIGSMFIATAKVDNIEYRIKGALFGKKEEIAMMVTQQNARGTDVHVYAMRE
jgi:hypothetical protein